MAEPTSIPGNGESTQRNAAGAHGGIADGGDSPQNSEQREELDDLIHKAQELVRNLDTLSMTAAPELTESGFAGEPQTIAELDQEIASSLDLALQDHHSTVDAVLDTVFEEQAAIVQQINRPLPPPEPPATEPIAEPKHAVDEKPVEVPHPVPEAPQAETVAAPASLVPATPLNALDAAAAAVAQAGEPVVAEVAQPVLPQAAPNAQLPRRGLAELAKTISRPAVPVLVAVNYPLRFVPASMRSAVDWLALTLLVWVPIVWIMVFTFGQPEGGEGNHAPHATSAASEHSSPANESHTPASADHSSGHR